MDQSNGWEAVAQELIAGRERSQIGVGVLRTWMRQLPPGGSVLDVGCGSGVPVSQTLMSEGFVVSGVDASPTLVAAFRKRFPHAAVACEPAERSPFFDKRFDAAVAIGLLFLLDPDAQRTVIHRVAAALNPGGRFLFTSPAQRCTWRDLMTQRESVSLGADAYTALLREAGLTVSANYTDGRR